MKRRWRVGLIILGVLILVGYGVFRYVLGVYLPAKVVAVLEEKYGGPVKVDSVEMGWQGSVIKGLRLFEPGDASKEEPWLVIDELQTDLSFKRLVELELLPDQVSITGLTAVLRFDRKGRLLTQFPPTKTDTATQTIPDIAIHDARVTIRQEGRPERTISGMEAAIHAHGQDVRVDATLDDPTLQAWKMGGSINLTTKAVAANMKSTRPIHVTRTRLQRLPFVAADVINRIEVDSFVPVDVAMHSRHLLDGLHYRVQLAPSKTRVTVPEIPLRVSELRGHVVVEDGALHLRGLKCDVLDGEVRANADATLKGSTVHVSLTDLEIRNVDVGHFAADVHQPKRIEGRLNLTTRLDVTLAQGKIRAKGKGSGQITHARIMGQPAAGPIKIEIHEIKNGAAVENHVTVTMRLDDFRLNPVPGQLGLKLPRPIHGALAIQARADIPLDTATSFDTYRAQVEATLNRFRFGEIDIERMTSTIRYAGGRIDVQKLSGYMAAGPEQGTFSGSAHARIFPRGELVARLEANNISLARFAKLLPDIEQKTDGAVSALVDARVAVNDAENIDAWQITGSVAGKTLRLLDVPVQTVRTKFGLWQGTLALTEARVEAAGAAATGHANVRLKAPFSYQGDLDLPHCDLAAVAELVHAAKIPPMTGNLTGKVRLTGTAEPLTLNTSGTLALNGASVDKVDLGRLALAWTSDLERLKVSSIQSISRSGVVTGHAVLPLRQTVAGGFMLEVKDLKLEEIAREFSLHAQGMVEATLKGTITAAAAQRDRAINVELDVKSPRLVVEKMATQRVQGTLAYEDGVVDVRLGGQALGGKFDVRGKGPLDVARFLPGAVVARPKAPADHDQGSGKKKQAEGQVRLQHVQLGQLLEALGPAGTGDLQGTIDANASFHFEGQQQFSGGSGRVSLRGLRAGAGELADNIQADIRIDPEKVSFPDISGDLAGGLLRGKLLYDLKTPDRSWFNLVLTSVDMARLSAPFAALRSKMDGELNADLRGSLGPIMRGSGQLTVNQGRLANVAVSDMRVPIDWQMAVPEGRMHLDIRDFSAQMAQGRLSGRASLDKGYASRLEGQVAFNSLNLPVLVRQFSDSSQLGTGRVSGKIDFSGNDVRSLNDVTANIQAKLGQTQALQFPVLQNLVPFLGGAVSTSSKNGDLRARVAGGVVHIQRLSLNDANMSIFLDGTVTSKGRLNLEVTASNGTVENAPPRFLRFLWASIPAFGPMPISLLLQSSKYLSNLTVHLRVAGTVTSPVVRVEPIGVLSEEAIRFFLSRGGFPIP